MRMHTRRLSRIPHTAFIGIMIVATLLVLSVSAACGKEDHERIAEDVAREWTMTEADGISEEIAEMATRRYGGRVFIQIVDDSSTSSSLVRSRQEALRGQNSDVGGRRPDTGDDAVGVRRQPRRRTGATKSLLRRRYPSTSCRPSRVTIFARCPSFTSPCLGRLTAVQLTTNWKSTRTAREVKNAKMPLASVRISRMSL